MNREFRDAVGRHSVWLEGNDIVIVSVGNISPAAVDPILEAMEACILAGGTRILADFFALNTYDQRLRTEAVRIVATHRSRITAVHVGGTSAMVRMGIAVANLALRIIFAHATRATFDALRKKAA